MLDENNLEQEIIRLIQYHVPEVELARQHGKELSLILPHHCVDRFAALFSELEYEISHGNRLKISSYGISMTTLEEVGILLIKIIEIFSIKFYFISVSIFFLGILVFRKTRRIGRRRRQHSE